MTPPVAQLLEAEAERIRLRLAVLYAERDEYRRQATLMTEALCDLGHDDLVGEIIAEA